MKQDKLLFLLAIIAVCLALFNLIVSVQKADLISSLTGYAINVGNVTLRIESSILVNFTTSVINWTSGRVNVGQTSATLSTSDGTVTNGNWTAVTSGLVLQNDGNTNVSLVLATGLSAANFLGGTSPDYEWNITNVDGGSCTNLTGINLSESWDVDTSGSLTICNPFAHANTKDTIKIDIKLVVPADAITGGKADTITATATGV